MAPAGGSSDWFLRPSGDSITAAVVIGGINEVAAIRVFNQGQTFEDSLSATLVDEWLNTKGSEFDMTN